VGGTEGKKRKQGLYTEGKKTILEVG